MNDFAQRLRAGGFIATAPHEASSGFRSGHIEPIMTNMAPIESVVLFRHPLPGLKRYLRGTAAPSVSLPKNDQSNCAGPFIGNGGGVVRGEVQ
jgi:hypothetical protein